ncbi:hypothetical protein EN803_38995, partial [Mesorhizobium sp. M2D.F.Ca.ET.160.01.1.1]
MSDVLCLRLQEVPQELLGVVGRMAVPSQLVEAETRLCAARTKSARKLLAFMPRRETIQQMAERHVREGEALIARQRRLIDKLAR